LGYSRIARITSKYAEPSDADAEGAPPEEPLAAPSFAVPALILPTSRSDPRRFVAGGKVKVCVRVYSVVSMGRERSVTGASVAVAGRAGVGGAEDTADAGVVAAFIFGRFDGSSGSSFSGEPCWGERKSAEDRSRRESSGSTSGDGGFRGGGMRTLAPPSPEMDSFGTIERAARWSERVP
jgi:uncharacterized membrane protein YgcG